MFESCFNVEELRAAAQFRVVYVVVDCLGYAPLALAPVMTFAITTRSLDVTTIFTSISYLLLLADPLGYLFQNTPNIIVAFACLERIQGFMEAEPRVDYRILDSRGLNNKREKEEMELKEEEEPVGSAIEIYKGELWMGKRHVVSQEYQPPHSSISTYHGGWACRVREVNLVQGSLRRGSSVARAGHDNAACVSRKVVYCDQIPYLFNATIRQNITGSSPFQQARYTSIIEATMLQPDLSTFLTGDGTTVGSQGITLSGGQKQRISMARA